MKRVSIATPVIRALLAIAVVALTHGCAPRPLPGGHTGPDAPPDASLDEARLERYVDAIRDDPARLTVLLREMPKGADLHSHLVGAAYAEGLLRLAVQDSLCVDASSLTLVAAGCGAGRDTIPARQALTDAGLHDRLVDAWSVRNTHPSRRSGHDQFFGTFDRFGAVHGHMGAMVAEVADRAAANGVGYLELMTSPAIGAFMALGASAGFDADLSRMREALLAAGLRDVVAAARREVHEGDARARALLGCGRPDARPGCGVTVRYLFQVLRAQPPEQVFAQILAGYELASRDTLVVGLNLVQPEDHPVAVRDYTLHMQMLGFLGGLYPGVPLTLHAGELTLGLVPPEELRSHIRQAVLVAGARRVGHGVDLAYEDDPLGLLREMARRGVLVEINLTSNAVILGVEGAAHPLSLYRQHGVPVALSTDDEGVLRTDITREYVRAVQDQGLGYRALKAMSRQALHHAFVEGESLWADASTFRPIAACDARVGGLASPPCQAFVSTSEKARLQWAHERALATFERAWRERLDAAPASE